VDEGKYWNLITSFFDSSSDGKICPPDLWAAIQADKQSATNSMAKVIDLCRLTLRHEDMGDPEKVRGLCEDYGIDVTVDIVEWIGLGAAKILSEGRQTMNRSIDFTDMVWGPAILKNVTPYTFPTVFVDEAQDLSPAQLAVAMKAR